LLKVTNANVWASIAVGRSFLAKTMGIKIHERAICGINATDSILMDERPGKAEVRYNCVL
jgi:hypothetical protein